MSYDAAIWSRFRTEWADRTPIAEPNVAFTKPNAAWVRPVLLPADAQQTSLAAPTLRDFRTTGLFVVQVFVPEGTGDGPAMVLAEQVAVIFRGVSADGVRYAGLAGEAPRVRVIGVADGFFQVNVEVPFQAFDTF